MSFAGVGNPPSPRPSPPRGQRGSWRLTDHYSLNTYSPSHYNFPHERAESGLESGAGRYRIAGAAEGPHRKVLHFPGKQLWRSDLSGAEDVDYGIHYGSQPCFLQSARNALNQRGVGREKLAGAGIARPIQSARSEIGFGDRYCLLIGIGVAGNLTEDPVASLNSGKNNRRTELAGGKIGKREPD